MVDYFGPEDDRWRYPQLDTEYEPNEGRCHYRVLDQAVQGHTTAKGQQMTVRMVKQRTFRKAGLCLSACVRSHKNWGPLVGVALLGRGIY